MVDDRHSDATTPPFEVVPPRDGRQSDAAFDIWRGAARLLRDHGFACLAELTLKGGRRADLVGLSERGEIWIVEVKSSVADFRADTKWSDYLDHCDRFFFAVDSAFPQEILPDDTGLIVADRYGGAILRDAVDHRLSAARRKSVTLLFARTSASRAHGLMDPPPSREMI